MKCKHCFYSQNLNKGNEISIDNIKKLAKSLKGVLNVSITGGEPFLRKDVGEVIQTFFRYAKPKVISVVTNGFQPKKISEVISDVLKNNQGIRLSVTVSLDGFESVHDKIRGTTGSFKKSIQTINNLKRIKKQFKNLNMGVISTLSSLNADIMLDFYDYIKNELIVDSIQVNLARGESCSPILDKKSIQIYKQIADKTKSDIYSSNLKGYSNFFGSGIYQAVNTLFREIIYKTAKTGKYQLPCAAGRLNGVIYPDGNVSSCEMLDNV
ncbi:radical SAM protein, partial [Candidatus Pacearchaeota archaeon]|nr:radical SAM protein [Candidatus Pacearchaeota archaeon]